MGERQQRHLETVRGFYGAGPSDDDTDRHPHAADEIVWNVPGANHVSGRYAGKAEVFETMPASMQPLDEWAITVRDVMVNGDLVVASVHVRGRRGELSVDCGGAHLFRLDEQSRIVEAWGFVDDQAALDALLDGPA